MYHEIKGIIYRVNFQYGSCFVECDEENAQEELYRFCAKKAASGKVISSVNRIFEDSSSTPRVSVLSQPEYKQAYREELARKERGDLEAGDRVYTPRFCNVTLEAVYGTEKELRAAGYTEPTHYQNDRYVIRGKSTGFNRMVFAAAVSLTKSAEGNFLSALFPFSTIVGSQVPEGGNEVSPVSVGILRAYKGSIANTRKVQSAVSGRWLLYIPPENMKRRNEK